MTTSDTWDPPGGWVNIPRSTPDDNGAPNVENPLSWLERASDLLNEPDPGPTPFLVQDLITDESIAAIYGPAKAGKTWLILELAIAIVTGRKALGTYDVPEQGPVILVLEESGRTALYRRLDALRRGMNQDVDEFEDLYVAANRRVRLNDDRWKEALILAGQAIKPRAYFLDPLVRLKGAEVNENDQLELGPILDYMRDLRDATGACVTFAHHVGHEGTRMRGSSDLDAYWESSIRLKREQGGPCEIQAEHREAESSPLMFYRLAFDITSMSMKLSPTEAETLEQKVAKQLDDDPFASANEIYKSLKEEGHGYRKSDVLEAVREHKMSSGSQPGTTGNHLVPAEAPGVVPTGGREYGVLSPREPPSSGELFEGPGTGVAPTSTRHGRGEMNVYERRDEVSTAETENRYWTNGITLKRLKGGETIWTIALCANSNSLDDMMETIAKIADIDQEMHTNFGDPA